MSVRRFFQGAGTAIQQGAGKARRVASNAIIKKDNPKTFLNLYTGLSEGPALKVAAWGAAGLYSYTAYQTGVRFDPKINQVNYEGEAPFLSYDAVANNTRSSAPTLSATGDLVFGMHKARRG